MDLLQSARYKDKPVYLFFEKYILDVIGELSEEKSEILQNINLQHVFGAKSDLWKDVVVEVLQLSPTINIAILEQWYRTKETTHSNNGEVDSNQFSKDFVDQYFDENSSIDKWTEDSLADAKSYIYDCIHLEKCDD